MREWEIWHHWFSSQVVLIRVERTSNYAISVQWMSWLFTFPAFLSICTKHANFYLWKFWPETPEVFSRWASMLPIGGNLYVPRSLHGFFSVTKPNPLFHLVPERCMSANERCAWSVCSNALPFVQYLEKLNLALSWSWYLVPACISPWAQFLFPYPDACMHMVL